MEPVKEKRSIKTLLQLLLDLCKKQGFELYTYDGKPLPSGICGMIWVLRFRKEITEDEQRFLSACIDTNKPRNTQPIGDFWWEQNERGNEIRLQFLQGLVDLYN